jgi:mannan endo-1,4-beta-mannosidase
MRAALGTVALCSALLAFIAPRPVFAATKPLTTTSGLVAAKGTELTVDGQPWKFAGYNLPCANPFDLSASQLDYYLDDIQQNSGANVIRVWFFQSQGGPGNWTGFDRVISALSSRGMRAIVTLANSTSTCDEPNAPTLYKTVSWYQSGYLSPYGGYSLSFHDFAVDVAAHYARNPSVAFWQLINEAQAPSYDASGNLGCPDELAARNALRTFSDSMTNAIHTVDPQHLVDLGTDSTGGCGISDDADYTYVHAGAVNLCEFHDYGEPATAMPAALAGIIDDCHSLGKPAYIGESGIPSNVGPDGTPSAGCNPWPSCSPYPITLQTLQQRATFFSSKIQAANGSGVAGYVIWVKSPFYTATTDAYAISDGEPTESVLPQALSPYPSGPPTAVPEAPYAIGLAVVCTGMFGSYALHARRRARKMMMS